MSKVSRLGVFEVPSKQYIFRKELFIADCIECGVMEEVGVIESLSNYGWVTNCDCKVAHPVSVSVALIYTGITPSPLKVFVGWCEEVDSDEVRLA